MAKRAGVEGLNKYCTPVAFMSRALLRSEWNYYSVEKQASFSYRSR